MPNPIIRALHPGDEAAVEAFCLPRLATSMFLIGNMRESGLTYNGKPHTGHYVAAFEDGEIVALAAHYWNGVLILQAPVHVAALCRAALQASMRPLGGLIGPHAQVVAARAALGLENTAAKMDSKELLYSLDLDDLIVPETLRTGRVMARRVEPRDVETLTRFRVGYSVEALGEQETEALWANERAGAERSAATGALWILEDDGIPVAKSAFNTRIDEAVQIGGVWTSPEFRSRGYARCVVAQSLLDARAGGATQAILFTGDDNIPAQKAYTSLGFRHIGDYHILLLSD